MQQEMGKLFHRRVKMQVERIFTSFIASAVSVFVSLGMILIIKEASAGPVPVELIGGILLGSILMGWNAGLSRARRAQECKLQS